MKNYGRTSIHEILGDLIVFRNLQPVDPRLPALSLVRRQLGLEEHAIPRKSQSEYAQVIVHLLKRARAFAAPGASIGWLVYVGDSRLSDGTSFANILRAGNWTGLAFICSENESTAQIRIEEHATGTLYLANRWSALADFDRYCGERGVPLGEQTAVILDLDKTALGARGRNDHIIDQVRLEAALLTVGDSLGENADVESFKIAYNRINQVEFHPFTTDNQDYLVYICLIVSSGQFALEQLVDRVRGGHISTFEQFLVEVDRRVDDLPPALRATHRHVYDFVQQGDPTPLKTFRRNEYKTTIGRMGTMGDHLPARDLLNGEILITQEVRIMALEWQKRGALLFGLSDKPDEASIPTEDLAARGCQPIHRVETHAVGG